MNLLWLRRNLLALVVVSAVTRAPAQTAGTPAQDQPPSQAQPQNQNPDQAPAQNPNEETNNQVGNTAASSESRAPVPLPLNIDAGSLEFSQELERSNYLRGGVNVGANYDDNLLSVNAPRIGGYSYSVMPDIALDLSRPRAVMILDYSGGYVVNQRFSAYNSASQNAGADLLFRLSPHVNLRLTDRFSLTTGFYDQIGASPTGLGTGVIQQPNLTVITPFARHTNDVGTVELTYQYSAGDMIGMSGTFDYSSFGAPPTGSAQLVDGQSEEADGFYTHRFTPRNWSGVAYVFQRLSFTPATESVDTHSLYLFHTIYLERRMQLAFFAGPEYSELSTQIVSTVVTVPLVSVVAVPDSQDRLSVAGGASFSWLGERTSIRASGLHKVSDGGGLLTAVEFTSGNASIRRQLTRSSTVELGAVYGDSRALDQAASTFSEVKSASGSLVWVQQLGRSFSTTLGYGRDYQQQTVVAASSENVNHNRGWVTLGYQFSKALGR